MIKKKQIILIGIGAFILGTINGITYLFGIILKHIQIWLAQKPIINFWTTELSIILLFILLGIFSLKWFNRKSDYSEKSLRKYFFFWVIGFFIVQIIQTSYGFFGTKFLIENKFDQFNFYVDKMRDEYLLNSYHSAFVILRYLIFALIIYIGQKTEPKIQI